MYIALFFLEEFNHIQTDGQTSLFVIFEILPKFDPIFMDEGLGIVKKPEDMLKIIALAFQKPKQS